MSYTYHISLNGSDYVEVFPKEGIQATKEVETGCVFHREKVSEVVLLEANNSVIYASLDSYYTDKTKFNNQLEFEIYDGVRAGTAYYYGLFSISDCKRDDERKIISFTPRTNDEYIDIFDKWENEYVVPVGALSLNIAKPIVEPISWSAGSPGEGTPDFDTFTEGATPDVIASIINTGEDTAARYTDIGSLQSDDLVILRVSGYIKNSGLDLTFRVYDSSDTDTTNEGPVTITGNGDYVVSLSGSYTTFLVLYATDEFNGSMTIDLWSIDTYVPSGCISSVAFVEYMLTSAYAMNLSMSVVSTIMDNDALPSDAPSTIDTWITSHGNGNYVTETEDSNQLNYLMFGNAQRWDAEYEPYRISLKTFLDYLRDMLQIYWYVDADGDFRIEHIKYFEKMTDDSTAITMASLSDYKPEVDHLITSYRKEQIVSREEFEWQQVTYNDTDFLGYPIIYDIFETSLNVKKYKLQITTDITYLTTDAGASNSGWCFYDTIFCDNGTDRYVINITVGAVSGNDKLNGYLSWANLHANYWTWKRMSENANVNGGVVTLDSAIRFLEHEGLRFFYSSEIAWYNKITTSLGTGEIISAVRDFDTNFVTLKIGYNPYE